MRRLMLSILTMTFALFSFAQTANIQGKITEKNQSIAIKNVQVKLIDQASKYVLDSALTDENGAFNFSIPTDKNYLIVADKKNFFEVERSLSANELSNPLQLELERKPGYVFDVSISEAGNWTTVNTIEGARIEIYNNTSRKEELVLNNHPKPSFLFNFEEGNHYTIMVRKKGYLNKRIEAYINIDGCILCFEGLGVVQPEIVDVMANDNQIGAFLGNIELEKIAINKTFKIENLYYDYNMDNIRPDAALVLENVLTVLKDNPGIKVEMGSHTDARGRNSYNMDLSQRRAQSAVAYLASRGLNARNLTWRGYGETQLINRCADGSTCGEDLHQQNRRTELKITGFEEIDPLDKKSLQEIVEVEGKNHYLIYQELSRVSQLTENE